MLPKHKKKQGDNKYEKVNHGMLNLKKEIRVAFNGKTKCHLSK